MAPAAYCIDVLPQTAALGLVPGMRPAQVVPTGLRRNHSTFLNIAFLGVLALLWWLHRHRERLGGGRGVATDPVCGMQVEVADAPASAEHGGRTVRSCSDGCRERFQAEPDRDAEPAKR